TSARRLPPAPDPLVRRAVLGVAGGVEELARDAALSERQLRRRFDDAVGFGPRTLRRVLRLQHFLRLAERAPGATLARLAADAGFADQAHLARDCRDLAGAPPSVLLGRGARAAGEPQTSGTSKAPLAAPAILGA
ncbi:MAG: AraC family transcriptional regulator, partial [Solirubrobacterales bacterium]|nr:AraC family transcriptional regulator [Solirubrobacterales bacterium]